MILIKISYLLVVVVIIQGSSKARTSDKIKKVQMDSMSHAQKEMYQQDAYFLYRLKKLDSSGRYINQSINDLEKLEPTCSCIDNPSLCNSNCCYCQLNCPAPVNSFTGELLIPSTEECSRDSIKAKDWMNNGRKEMKTIIPWECTDLDKYKDASSRVLSFLCIQDRNMDSYKLTYNTNPGFTRSKILEPSASYNWQQHHNYTNRSANTFLRRVNIRELLTVVGENEDWMHDETMVVMNGINFTKEYDDKNGIFRMQILTNPRFKIKAQPMCSRLARGHSLEECVYFINATSFETCNQLRDAVNITTHIVAYLLTNRTNRLDTTMRAKNTKNSESEGDNCSRIPSRGVITEVFHRNTLIGVHSNFDQYKDYDGHESFNEISLTLAYKLVYVSDKELMNLPKYWEEFKYGECLEKYCWRDIGEIAPTEAWKQRKLDEVLLRNIIYWFMPFIPFLVYCFVDIIYSF